MRGHPSHHGVKLCSITTESNSAVSLRSHTLRCHHGVKLCGVTTESNSAVSLRSQTLRCHHGVKLCSITAESNSAVSPRSQALRPFKPDLCNFSNDFFLCFVKFLTLLFCMIKTSFEDISRQFLNIKHHADTAER